MPVSEELKQGALEASKAVFGEKIYNALRSASSISDIRIIRDAGLQCFINNRDDAVAGVIRYYLCTLLDEKGT